VSRRSTDPSVLAEPHLRGKGFALDPSEARAREVVNRPSSGRAREDEAIEHTVWDDPGLSAELASLGPAGEGGSGPRTYG